MSADSANEAVNASELRQRNPHPASSGDNVGPTDAGPANASPEAVSAAEVKAKKTYGRTPDGTGKFLACVVTH